MTKKDPFGLLAFLPWNHAWNNFQFPDEVLNQVVDQLCDLGISFIRMDVLWADIHRGDRQYNFEKYDRIIDLVASRGINILGILHYNKFHTVDGKEVWSQPPESFDEFADFVGAAVGRYKNQIQHWEIWNEPNHPIYWAGPKDGLKSYARLLKKSYRVAKKANPASVILNGALTGTIIEDVENLYKEAGREAFDILAVHPFVNPLSPVAEKTFDSIIQGTQKVMAKYKDPKKKIWITEMGCPGVPKGEKSHTWFEGKALNEDQQAEWLEKQYGFLAKHPQVEKLFWAFYRDTDNNFKDATDHLGIVRKNLTPKPAFHVLKKLIQEHHSYLAR